MAHITRGARKVLELPFIYNLFQTLIGANAHRKKHFKKYFDLDSRSKILDIGCGTGALLDSLKDDVHYIGCDMEKKYIDYAKSKFGNRGDFYMERVGEKMRSDWYNYFDAINAHGLLHHLNDSDSAILLETGHKYLKPGGFMVTVDSVFHDNQSFLSKWIVSKDRGQNIRNPEQYLYLAKKYFSNIQSFVSDDYALIPFSVFTMVLYK